MNNQRGNSSQTKKDRNNSRQNIYTEEMMHGEYNRNKIMHEFSIEKRNQRKS